MRRRCVWTSSKDLLGPVFFSSTRWGGGCRFQSQSSLGSTRDKQRVQPCADPTTGNQMTFIEAPDFTPHLEFGLNNLEHVKIPDVGAERRARTDMEKEREMQKRFGPRGPGERLTKSSPQLRRDMLAKQQDVDSLPWEVRWRKSLIPTPEEVVQDIRDRFDLYIQDPIEREQEWYLHWKDRAFKVQKDRMIWPQGYTDYLDHYDENGRRRVLPTDQRWSDTSWKHLADTQYRDRMWLIEGEERKAVHQSFRSERALMEEEEKRQHEMGDVFQGILSGVIDLDPDQTYQALAGSADPMEVARTKLKITEYGAQQALAMGQPVDPARIDLISGFPKADMEPLPSGLSVEQGAAIVAQVNTHHEMLEQRAEAARQAGHDPAVAMLKSQLGASKQHQDRPVRQAQVEDMVKKVRLLKKAQGAGVEEAGAPDDVSLPEDGVVSTGIENASEKALSLSPQRETPKPKDGGCFPREGFIELGKRSDAAEASLPRELYCAPAGAELDDLPDWYRTTLVETEPLIQSYDMVHDTLEVRDTKAEYYQQPPLCLEDRITNDDATSGASAFDECKMHRLKTLPELVEGYKPLPLFREVANSASPAQRPGGKTEEEKPMKRSEKLRRERQEKLRRQKIQYDPDILLPTLPWETDSVVDPYRGVEENDAIDFNRKNLEKTWAAYRGTFQQAVTEFGNLTQVTSEDQCEKMLYETIERFQTGKVSDHPNIPEEQEAVFRLVFEAHTRHFLADFYKFKGNRVTEANAVKAEADEILRKASAKSKLLGKNFMNFIHEMTALELDTVRKNPIQRYTILVQSKKYEPLIKPFLKWMQNELEEFIKTEFEDVQQLDTHCEFLTRHINDTKHQCPMRIEGVSDASRDAAVEAIFLWCRGALCFFTAKHFFRFFIAYSDTRFRSRAESLFEDSIEWFCNYNKAGKNILQIPIPESDPPYEYDEKEFLDGESAVFAEVSGQLDKAEAIWHSGSSKRWYPLIDETEYMWFNERRGRLSTALDISDRCLENVNKKTHPSVHPFPERARIFLEGAPLTQETAEHLWLRYMGDLYWEHSEFMMRQGRFQTARSYREKCLNFYHVAIRTAQERLPPLWKATLLTKAKFILRSYEPGMDLSCHLQEVEAVIAGLFREKEPRHWVEPFTDLPYRIAVAHANLPAYGEFITKETVRRLQWQPSNELLMKNMELRARGGATLPELERYFNTINQVAEEAFRKKVLQWRAKEKEGSDAYLFWTHLYFAFRVYPKDPKEVQRLWDMYEPAFLYIYTHCALALRRRGQFLINDALRRMCQILLPGNMEQKKILMTELTKVREKMSQFVDRKELDRTINALDNHLVNSSKPTYIYGTSLLHKETMQQEKIARNPLLRSKLGVKDYKELLERQAQIREHSVTLDPNQAKMLQCEKDGSTSEEKETLFSQPNLSTKSYLIKFFVLSF